MMGDSRYTNSLVDDDNNFWRHNANNMLQQQQQIIDGEHNNTNNVSSSSTLSCFPPPFKRMKHSFNRLSSSLEMNDNSSMEYDCCTMTTTTTTCSNNNNEQNESRYNHKNDVVNHSVEYLTDQSMEYENEVNGKASGDSTMSSNLQRNHDPILDEATTSSLSFVQRRQQHKRRWTNATTTGGRSSTISSTSSNVSSTLTEASLVEHDTDDDDILFKLDSDLDNDNSKQRQQRQNTIDDIDVLVSNWDTNFVFLVDNTTTNANGTNRRRTKEQVQQAKRSIYRAHISNSFNNSNDKMQRNIN